MDIMSQMWAKFEQTNCVLMEQRSSAVKTNLNSMHFCPFPYDACKGRSGWLFDCTENSLQTSAQL